MATKEEFVKRIEADCKRGEKPLADFIKWCESKEWFGDLELRNRLWFVEHEVWSANFAVKFHAGKMMEEVGG